MWYVKRNDNGWDIISFVFDFEGEFVCFKSKEKVDKWLMHKNKYAPDHINYFCIEVKEEL